MQKKALANFNQQKIITYFQAIKEDKHFEWEDASIDVVAKEEQICPSN